MINFSLPLNVRVCRVGRFIALTPAAPFLDSATVAAVISKSFRPNALEKRTRIWSPPIDVCIVWRMVEFVKTEVGVVYSANIRDIYIHVGLMKLGTHKRGWWQVPRLC
jgi:hypothetical protein